MSYEQPDGSEGLLAKNLLRKTVDADLDNYTAEIKKVDPNDAPLNTALFRDFTMLGASYLLEPCHINYLKDGNYGAGMDRLPEKLAVPMKLLADRLNYKQPLLDYAQAYALYNWKLTDDADPENPHYHNDDIVKSTEDPLGNIELIRKFHGGQDEAGFILLHVAIVSKSYKQAQAYDKIYAGIADNNRDLVNKGLEETVAYLEEINGLFNSMWTQSSPAAYLKFRTFIMGIQGNEDIFQTGGVVYEGVEEYNGKIMAFRGETGAQDSIIPAMDSALGLEYPRNSLTEYLFELRDYRPYHHQKYINELRQSAVEHKFKDYAMQDSYSTYLLLNSMHQTFKFRHQHWTMVKKYIMDNSKYPRATGGTPITTWLPNQIGAVLEYCQVLGASIDPNHLNNEQKAKYEQIKSDVDKDIKKLFNEVSGMQSVYGAGQDFDQFQTRAQ